MEFVVSISIVLWRGYILNTLVKLCISDWHVLWNKTSGGFSGGARFFWQFFLGTPHWNLASKLGNNGLSWQKTCSFDLLSRLSLAEVITTKMCATYIWLLECLFAYDQWTYYKPNRLRTFSSRSVYFGPCSNAIHALKYKSSCFFHVWDFSVSPLPIKPR